MVYIKGIPRSTRFRRAAILHLGLEDEFPWGVHKNRTIQWVLRHNPSYIDWIAGNVEPEMNVRFRFEAPVMEALRSIKQSPDYVDGDPLTFYRDYFRLKDRLIQPAEAKNDS